MGLLLVRSLVQAYQAAAKIPRVQRDQLESAQAHHRSLKVTMRGIGMTSAYVQLDFKEPRANVLWYTKLFLPFVSEPTALF